MAGVGSAEIANFSATTAGTAANVTADDSNSVAGAGLVTLFTAAITNAWQLEGSSDLWQLEGSTDVWLLES